MIEPLEIYQVATYATRATMAKRYAEFFGHSCLVKFTNRRSYEDSEENVHPGTG